MRLIHTREEFIALKDELGVRMDWHEPDEQEVDVRLVGRNFDNAGFWPQSEKYPIPASIMERHVVFRKEGKPVAAVNLATLCAWASDPEPRGTKRTPLNAELYDEIVEAQNR